MGPYLCQYNCFPIGFVFLFLLFQSNGEVS